MFKFIKNKFLFILLISIATLVVLVIGSLSLYKDNSLTFKDDGYIIETSTKSNTKYYFSANTKYKENVEEKITFSDKDSNEVVVEPASFVHYENGNIAFLKKGALVNLADITAPMVSYYNINNENTIFYEDNLYTVTSNDKKISIESFIGRISDDKYLIAGKDLSLKIPTEEADISGEYFEILYVEEGIVRIANQENSYQVTAQDSYIYVGDDIAINLGTGKILYNGDVKMLLSQITISGDENINLDIDDKTSGGGSGDGSGSGTGEGSGEDGDAAGDGTGEGIEGDGTSTGEGAETGEGTGSGTGDGTGTGGTGTGDSGSKTTASPKIELIEAIVTSTEIDLTMQLNNATLAQGNIVAYLTNVANGNKETPKRIELVNGTFKLPYQALMPGSEYALTIVETGIESEKQYFQKTFRTEELGISLEKTYATDTKLAYKINFDENTDVDKVHISIYDNNGTNTSISPNEFTISRDELNNTIEFTGLKSNTSYSINVDKIWIEGMAYSDLYTINRIDTTLKETPIIKDVDVETDAEEVKFTIKLNDVTDNDKSIISYTYNIYLANDITSENTSPTVQYSVVKTDSDPLVLNLNEITELKTGVDYRCKIIAQYNDNEMIREVSTDYSNNFLIKSKPKISFELTEANMSSIKGVLTLLDANCTVPMSGRACANSSNNFILRYYELEKEEITALEEKITFDPKTLTANVTIGDEEGKALKSNTTYVVKMYGSYYDDDNELKPNVQIGEAFYVTTDKSPEIYFEVVKDNDSGAKNGEIVTFDARLTVPQNTDLEQLIEELDAITLKLYKGRYNATDKLIGTYTITDKKTLEMYFNNVTITNSLFEDVTNNKVGKIDSLEKLIKVTNNSTGTLNGDYTLNGAYTVEIEAKLSETETKTIENNIYTFALTPSYYLDSRIASNKGPYLIVDKIEKQALFDGEEETEEYKNLTNQVSKVKDLQGTTTVGITIANSLSDDFVNSAFVYQKVVVDYIICNETIYDCETIINDIVESTNKLYGTEELKEDEKQRLTNLINENKEKVQILSVDMGNKYQPKEQTIYLDFDSTYFTRGYKYRVGYIINFTMNEEASIVYSNKVLFQNIEIAKQAPIYTQYISTSNKKGITYRYTITDIDNEITDKSFYYSLGTEDKDRTYTKIEGKMVIDGTSNNVTIPITKNETYKLYYMSKDFDNNNKYNEIITNEFETEYIYDNNSAFELIKGTNDNTLKIKLLENDVTNRAVAYKVTISSTEIDSYEKYFIASKLNTITLSEGTTDSEGNTITITKDYKYIAIDYAEISEFLGKDLKVSVTSYYDSGLMGYNQSIPNGFVLKNKDNNYLNLYYSTSYKNGVLNYSTNSTTSTANMGIYDAINKEDIGKSKTINVYNKFNVRENYNNFKGTDLLENTPIKEGKVGINFSATPQQEGMLLHFTDSTNKEYKYLGYDLQALNTSILKTEEKTDEEIVLVEYAKYKFDTIIPTVNISTESTINSITVNATPSGFYGDKQITEENADIQLCTDEECANVVATQSSTITIDKTENGYVAEMTPVTFTNLNPETTYYTRVLAYVGGEYKQLYDTTETSKGNGYVLKTVSTKTLNASDIFKEIKFNVTTNGYDNGNEYEINIGTDETPNNIKIKTSTKQIDWTLTLKNTKNYNLRFELYKNNGIKTEIDPETGETKKEINYELVNFDGSASSNCNKTAYVTDGSNGYVNNCYILIPSEKIDDINEEKQTYKFTGNDFIFEQDKYKLKIYAIPEYTEGNETKELLIYEGTNLNIDSMTEPTVEFSDLNSGIDEYVIDENQPSKSFYISVDPFVTDKKYTITNNGNYQLRLIKGSTMIKTCDYYLNGNKVENGNCIINLEANDNLGTTVKFVNLSSDTRYQVEITYNTYINNVYTTKTERKNIYTTKDDGIAFGIVNTTSEINNTIILTYTGSSNLNLINKIKYTISNANSNTGETVTRCLYTGNNTTGSDDGCEKVDSIFEISSGAITTAKINTYANLDAEKSGQPIFTFKTKNTYNIDIQYYKDDNLINEDYKLFEP